LKTLLGQNHFEVRNMNLVIVARVDVVALIGALVVGFVVVVVVVVVVVGVGVVVELVVQKALVVGQSFVDFFVQQFFVVVVVVVAGVLDVVLWIYFYD
jgi:hypothetical protein